MAEAAHAVLTAYFNHPDAAPMWSGYITGNTRSAALLHRMGFSTTGVVTQHHSRALHAVVNIRQMILSPEQWHAVNPVEITTPRVRAYAPCDPLTCLIWCALQAMIRWHQ